MAIHAAAPHFYTACYFKDSESFTSFTVWELVFAPSITQRKLIWAIQRAYRWLGTPAGQITGLINKRLKNNKGSKAHSIRIDAAEEDEHILIHSWTSESLWGIYPFRDELLPYFFFDRDLPKAKQRQTMKFYKNMIQRHLYAHGGNKILLSKNPSHSAKLAALTETFPDARFINLVRTPYEAMPSMLDYMSTGWTLFCDPLEPYPYKENFFEVMRFYYTYPVEYFKDKENRCNFIKYEDLVHQPVEIIEDVYDWLGLSYSAKFKAIVEADIKEIPKIPQQSQLCDWENGADRGKNLPGIRGSIQLF